MGLFARKTKCNHPEHISNERLVIILSQTSAALAILSTTVGDVVDYVNGLSADSDDAANAASVEAINSTLQGLLPASVPTDGSTPVVTAPVVETPAATGPVPGVVDAVHNPLGLS